MNIPVQFVKITKPTIFEQQLPEQFEELKQQLMQQQMQQLTMLPQQQTQLCNTLPQQKQQQLKKWLTTVSLMEMQLLKNVIRKQQLNQQHFQIKVDRQQRIVIVKLNKQLTQVPFKRVIVVPQNINICQLKVKFVPEQQVILVKAPYTNCINTCCVTVNQQSLQQEQELLNCFTEELLQQQVKVCQPTVYKMMKQMRQHLPTFVVPRCLRQVQTGELKVVLDVQCPEQFQPEQMQVKLNTVERCLAIKMLCQQLQKEQLICNNNTQLFVPKQMRHEYVLPQFVYVPKVNWFKLNPRVVRIELPILLQLLKQQQKQQQQFKQICNNTY